MNYFAGRIALGVAVGVLGIAVSGGFAADSGIDALANGVFIHRDSKTSVKIPEGWKTQDPYRLRKTLPYSFLSLDKPDPRISVTIVWSPLNKPWNEIVRAAADENLGEEHALLAQIYGKNKISQPVTLPVGPFTVYKILIDDGPEGPAKSAGAVYLFETGTGENRWKVKIRAVYPQINREQHMKQVEEIISQFSAAPEKGS